MTRVGGEHRYETAAELAGFFDTGLEAVYVATGEGAPDAGPGLALADALTAASVAGAQGSPVLLTQRGHLPSATVAALERLEPQAIVLVGGETAVDGDVEEALAAIAPTTRAEGEDRYGTAVALTQGQALDGEVLYLASGLGFPDALAGSALAGSQGAPLLIVNEGVPEVVAQEVLRLSPPGITILGGDAAVDSDTEQALQDLLDTTSTD